MNRTWAFARGIFLLALTRMILVPLVAQPAAPTAARPPASDAVLYPRTDNAGEAHKTEGWGGGGTAVLVVILGAAAGWMIWNKLRRQGAMGGTEQKLSIKETRSLGNRQFLVVASYQDRRFLLGVCPGRIDLLAPLDGGERPPIDRT